MRGRGFLRSARLALPIVALFAGSAPAEAQRSEAPDPPRFGLGYVANAPELLAGAGAYVILPILGGLGLYLDAKFDADPRTGDDRFEEDLTAQEVDDEIGDEFRDDDSSFRSFNAAVVRPVTPSLMLYGGLGYTEETFYRQYYDETGTRGLAGSYWVAAPGLDTSGLNVLAGMFLRMTSRFNAQFGVESAPRGATVGISVSLP